MQPASLPKGNVSFKSNAKDSTLIFLLVFNYYGLMFGTKFASTKKKNELVHLHLFWISHCNKVHNITLLNHFKVKCWLKSNYRK